MKRVALALTALAATAALAPRAYAAPDATNAAPLQGNLQVETLVPDALATTTPNDASVEAIHLENLDRAETTLNQQHPENAGNNVVLEVIVIELE